MDLNMEKSTWWDKLFCKKPKIDVHTEKSGCDFKLDHLGLDTNSSLNMFGYNCEHEHMGLDIDICENSIHFFSNFVRF